MYRQFFPVKALTVLLILASAATSSAQSEICDWVSDGTPPRVSEILGEWDWYCKRQGWDPNTYTPDTEGYSQQFRFYFLPEYKDILIRVYRDGILYSSSWLHLPSSDPEQLLDWTVMGQFRLENDHLAIDGYFFDGTFYGLTRGASVRNSAHSWSALKARW